MKPLIPVEIEFTVGFKQGGVWLAKKGDRFLALPAGSRWSIKIGDFDYIMYYQQGASNRPGRFRPADFRKGYAKLAANSPINQLAEILYCF